MMHFICASDLNFHVDKPLRNSSRQTREYIYTADALAKSNWMLGNTRWGPVSIGISTELLDPITVRKLAIPMRNVIGTSPLDLTPLFGHS